MIFVLVGGWRGGKGCGSTLRRERWRRISWQVAFKSAKNKQSQPHKPRQYVQILTLEKHDHISLFISVASETLVPKLPPFTFIPLICIKRLNEVHCYLWKLSLWKMRALNFVPSRGKITLCTINPPSGTKMIEGCWNKQRKRNDKKSSKNKIHHSPPVTNTAKLLTWFLVHEETLLLKLTTTDICRQRTDVANSFAN